MFVTLEGELNSALGIFAKTKQKLANVISRATEKDNALLEEEDRIARERMAIAKVIKKATDTTSKIEQLIG